MFSRTLPDTVTNWTMSTWQWNGGDLDTCTPIDQPTNTISTFKKFFVRSVGNQYSLLLV